MIDETKTVRDAQAKGFRQPPDHVTEPCLVYMARIMELRRFVGFYFGFVKTSEKLKEIAANDTEGLEEKAMEVLEYKYSEQRPFMNQIMLSRATESFDLYLITALRDIFLAKPEMLKSDGKIDINSIIDSGSYEDLIWKVVERKIHELSYKSLSDLRKFVLTRTGIELFPSEEAFEITLLATEVRNLIAHNDCVVNEVFRSKTKSIEVPLEISDTGRVAIDDDWLHQASYTMDSLVFGFDEISAEKFELRTLFRMGAVILRS